MRITDLKVSARTIATSADGAHSVFAIDLDSDGDIDVLSASFNDDKIAWCENNGSKLHFTHDAITAMGARLFRYRY